MWGLDDGGAPLFLFLNWWRCVVGYVGLLSKPLRSGSGAYVYRGYRVRRAPGPGSERHRRWVVVGKESVFGSFPSMRAACETIDMLYPRKTPS